MKVNKSLMRAYLDTPEVFRRILITDAQIKMVRAVQRRGYPTSTSKEIADYLDISLQSASIRLRRLWELGYLKREERVDVTGGIYYVYSDNTTSAQKEEEEKEMVNQNGS